MRIHTQSLAWFRTRLPQFAAGLMVIAMQCILRQTRPGTKVPRQEFIKNVVMTNGSDKTKQL